MTVIFAEIHTEQLNSGSIISEIITCSVNFAVPVIPVTEQETLLHSAFFRQTSLLQK